MISAVAGMSASARRALLTICTMTATIMQALDTTIANVALPYMQGSLSASYDQISWVLTSYIVAAAVMTAPVGWLADRFGRKKLFIVCVGGFTIASFLCALAQNIEQIVAFRLLQGMCGAALVPLSQSVMLDAYPIEQRGQAMGIWGMGVMLGPIMGPTLGGLLTDNYSWHWVFLVNIPVGILTVLGLLVFMDETKRHEHLRFDWFGFLALAVGIGSLQLMLDRGQHLGWFTSPEIVAEAIISVAGFYYFFAHSLTTNEPFVRFAIFRDRNFLIASFFMMIMGLMLFSSMALATPFLQNVLGYPIATTGWVLASRGVGTLLAMLIIGRLLRHFEARYLILIGLSLTAATLYQMTGFTANTSTARDRDLRPGPGLRHGIRVRPDEHRGVPHLAGAAAHRRDRDAHPGAQRRELGRDIGRDRQPHQQDDRVLQPVHRTPDAVQRRAAGPGRRALDRSRHRPGPRACRPDAEPAGVDHGLCGRLRAAGGGLRAGDPVRDRGRLDRVAARRTRVAARAGAGDGVD